MLVKELIEKLKTLNPELEVGIGYEYGDYYNTTVIENVEEVFATVTKKSSISGYRELVDEYGEDDMVVLGRF